MPIIKKITETNVRIGPVRFSYANVFAPRVGEDGKPGKYSLCVIIPKDDKEIMRTVNEAIEAAKLDGKANKWGGKVPANCKTPIRDGDIDREDDAAFHDSWFLNCSSKNRPGVQLLENGIPVDALDTEDFYSGCYGAVTLRFFPYDSNGNRGVGVGLNNCIKLKDGEKLSGGRSAEEDFADLAGN